MTKAKGNRDFLSSECVVGTALRVDRTYLGGQFEKGDGVTLDCDASVYAQSKVGLSLRSGAE